MAGLGVQQYRTTELTNCLEQGLTAIAPTLADAGQRRTVPLRGPAQPKSRARTSNLSPNRRLRGCRVLARLFEKDV